MKIDLNSIDKNQFKIKEGRIAGEDVFLVCPQKEGTEWTRENLHLRSSIWNKDGEPVSLGLKKFFNFSEKPHLGEPEPDELMHAITKMDGSCIIVSKYKGELIVRTRETISAVIHPTWKELDELVNKKYPEIEKYLDAVGDFSLIFENTTPNNRIVINYDKPDLILLNVIDHENYSYFGQPMVDRVAQTIGVSRPAYFKFDSIDELVEKGKVEKSIEGWCLYYAGDQEIRKLKTDFYLACHRLKYGISKNQLIDLFLSSGATNEEGFRKKLGEVHDYEIMSGLDLSDLMKGVDFVNQIEQELIPIASEISQISDKKTRALEVQRLVPSKMQGYLFTILKYGKLDERTRRKIMQNI